MNAERSWQKGGLGLLALTALALGCVSTEYGYEPPGQPSDRASGAVPAGSLGVCKVPESKKPPLVSATLWEHARPCSARTPASFIRLGYGRGGEGASGAPEADAQMGRMLEVLGRAPKGEDGKTDFAAMLRALREEAIKDPALASRVARDPGAKSCDIPYLLNTMARERPNVAAGACTAEVYDQQARTEACLFDTGREEALWLTSAWDCVTFTEAVGREQSCHRLCAYDDYCAKQVSCAAPELDLILCAMGVCVPEARAVF